MNKKKENLIENDNADTNIDNADKTLKETNADKVEEKISENTIPSETKENVANDEMNKTSGSFVTTEEVEELDLWENEPSKPKEEAPTNVITGSIPDDTIEEKMPKKKEKKGKWKLLVIVLIIVIGIGIIGFGLYYMAEDNNEELEKKFGNMALDYFDKNGRITTAMGANKITLKNLSDANKEGENYDLSDFKNCNEEKTYAIVSYDYSTGETKDPEIKLECEAF